MSCYVDIKDGDNNTPLMMCSRNGHLDCVKLLIDVSTFFIYKSEGGWLKRAHLTNTHSQGFFVNMSPPGVKPVLPSWNVVTASPPSRTSYFQPTEVFLFFTFI